MIKGTFRLGGELIDVVVDRTNVLFSIGNSITPISGLKLNKAGVIREHPDLKDDEGWRLKAIKRFNIHIKKYKLEEEKLEYIKDELKKHGYQPLHKQRGGHRPKRF